MNRLIPVPTKEKESADTKNDGNAHQNKQCANTSTLVACVFLLPEDSEPVLGLLQKLGIHARPLSSSAPDDEHGLHPNRIREFLVEPFRGCQLPGCIEKYLVSLRRPPQNRVPQNCGATGIPAIRP
jgi:hypothetical protein